MTRGGADPPPAAAKFPSKRGLMGIEQLTDELALSIRARYPILYLVSWEEGRVQGALKEVAAKLGKQVYFWTCTDGFDNEALNQQEGNKVNPALDRVVASPERAVFVFKDLHAFLEDHRVVRKLRDTAEHLRRSYKTLVILSPVLKIPTELEKDITVFDIPLPDLEEMGGILRNFLRAVEDNPNVDVDWDDELLERVIKACLGLTANEAENVMAKSLVADRRFSVDDLPKIISEKKQIIRKSGMLEYYELDETMDHVGGLGALKRWLANRANAFSEKAREFGLPEPKGVLLLGVQGCGKSLAAKATAAEWKLPLLRLDVGMIFNSFIGSSEENMRKAIRTAESLAPAVLWLDEIEKGFSGSVGAGMVDAGTSSRVFATFLTWLQEKSAPVFVFATANDIWSLPPEFFRKGRFDEVFFVDLPHKQERREIFSIHLSRRGRDPGRFDLDALAEASEGMSGAEIEQSVISAMYEVFPCGRDIETGDVMRAMKATVPLSVTMKEKIDDVRRWASTRARMASLLEREETGQAGGEQGE